MFTTLSYDQRGRKIGMNDPAMGVWSYGYNAFGELDRRVNAFGLLDDAKLRIAKLSKRERQVMQGLLDGLPNKLIAYHLGLSIRAGVSMDDPVDLISFEKTA